MQTERAWGSGDSQHQIHERGSNAEGLWADLIRAKYLGDRDFFDKDMPTRGSQFWNAIQKIKWHFELGAKHKVQNGKHTFF
jgi:hypothetical protein